MENFKIGDSVDIINAHKYKSDINYGLSKYNIKHGNYEYREKGQIVNKEKDCYIVNYINSMGNEMQLGFLKEDIRLVKSAVSKPIAIW